MEKINGKVYYTQEELDVMISESIFKNAQQLAKDIKNKKLKSKVIEYV